MTETEKRSMTMDGEAAAGVGNGAPPAETAEASEPERIAAERDEFLDQLQRSRAEFANYRRRTEQERGAIRQIANQALLAQILPVYDDLQRAIAAIPAGQRDSPLAEGVGLIERKLWSILERAGVSAIAAEGEAFDPALHEAVEMIPGGNGQADTVVAVYQAGYRLGDALLRPAMVKVGSAEESRQSPVAGGQDDEGGTTGDG